MRTPHWERERTVTVDHQGQPDKRGPFHVTFRLMRVEKDGAARIEVTGISLDSQAEPITTAIWRAIAVKQLLRHVLDEMAADVEALQATGRLGHMIDGVLRAGPPPAAEFVDRQTYFEAERAALRPDGKRRWVTPELLQEVARLHMESGVRGDPRRYVARSMQTSESTASRWIAKAREAGYLDPSGRIRKPKGQEK